MSRNEFGQRIDGDETRQTVREREAAKKAALLNPMTEREQRLNAIARYVESLENFDDAAFLRQVAERERGLEALLLEARSELDRVGYAWGIIDRIDAARAKPIAHTDHPLRHFDRTCPACLVEQPDDWQRGMEQAAKICDERAAKHGTDDEAENEPLLCAALIRVWI